MQKFTVKLEETYDDKLGGLTIAVNGIPIYGEGQTREEAVADLLDSVNDYCEIYIQKRDLYSRHDSKDVQELMESLIKYKNNKEKLKEILGL